MKKNMIALAVAGALVAPVAMAEVTVSGGLQAELVQIGGDANSLNGLYATDAWQVNKEGGGSYGFLKFSASEDLGGGLKALAMYNMAINVGDSDRAGLDTRDAYVGLSGGLGTVLAGSLSTPYKSSTVGYDPFLATSFQARGNYGMSTLHNGYVSNAVAYANSFAGGMVKVVAALVLDEAGPKNDATGAATDKTVGQHAKSFSVNIDPMKGLDIAIAYIDVTDFGNTNVDVANMGDESKTAIKFGAKYSASAFAVGGQVEMLDKGLTASGDSGNVVYVTGTFNVNEANSISVAVGQEDANVNSTAAEIAAGTDGVAAYTALGFKHSFSKSTSMTVGYRASDDKREFGAKETAIGAGLRVGF